MRGRAARVRNVLLALFLLVVAACGFAPQPEEPDVAPDPESATLVERSLRDVERFWGANYPEVSGGKEFTPIQGGYHPYTEADPPPDCGPQRGEYQPNAFYCPVDDFIAWDAQKLIPQLRQEFGPLLVGVVMAHEFGHAIQARLGVMRQQTVVLEQQADCYAGAWVADVLAGRSTAFKDVSPDQLDDTVAGVLLLRDQPGTSAEAEGAHGNAFDRVRALQDGVEKDVRTCAGYRADNLPVTEVPFTTEEEAATGGDLPYDEAVSLLTENAQQYWGRTFPRLAGGTWQTLRVQPYDPASPPSCRAPEPAAEGGAFYCPDGDYVAFDNRRLGPTLHERIGDFAVGMLVGDLFARAAQDRRGQPTSTRAGQLAVDCLAGSWTNDLLVRGQQSQDIRLSPGDLDEAVTALLAFGRAKDASNSGPSAFDRIGSYRKGVLQGLAACG